MTTRKFPTELRIALCNYEPPKTTLADLSKWRPSKPTTPDIISHDDADDSPPDLPQPSRAPASKKPANYFDMLSEESQKRIIDVTRERLQQILSAQTVGTSADFEVGFATPAYLISLDTFREIALQAVTEIVPSLDARYTSQIPTVVRRKLQETGMIRTVSELPSKNEKLKHLKRQVYLIIGVHEAGLEENIDQFDALMQTVLSSISVRIIEFVRANLTLRFRQSLLRNLVRQDKISPELLECAFNSLVRLGIVQQDREKFGFIFASDAVNRLEKLAV